MADGKHHCVQIMRPVHSWRPLLFPPLFSFCDEAYAGATSILRGTMVSVDGTNSQAPTTQAEAEKPDPKHPGTSLLLPEQFAERSRPPMRFQRADWP